MAIISFKYKFVYVKTVKTAGTAFEISLAPHLGPDDIVTPIGPPVAGHLPKNFHRGGGKKNWYNHMPVSEIQEWLGPDISKEMYFFTVEREPVDKCLSYFHFRRAWRRHGQGGEYEKTWEQYIEERDFPNDVDKYSIEIDGKKQLGVDEVIPYEVLEEGARRILAERGVSDFRMTSRAKSDFRPGQKPDISDVSEQDRAIIYESFADDLRVSELYERYTGVRAPQETKVAGALPEIGHRSAGRRRATAIRYDFHRPANPAAMARLSAHFETTSVLHAMRLLSPNLLGFFGDSLLAYFDGLTEKAKASGQNSGKIGQQLMRGRIDFDDVSNYFGVPEFAFEKHLLEILKTSSAKDILASLLGDDDLMAFAITGRIKLPGQATTFLPFHQDNFFLGCNSRVLTLMIPVLAEPPNPPMLEVISEAVPEIITPREQKTIYKNLEISDAYVEEEYGESLCAPRLHVGDALIFTGHALHRSETPTEGHGRRISIDVRVMAKRHAVNEVTNMPGLSFDDLAVIRPAA